MFLLNETLKAKIYSKIKSELTFCPIEQVCFEEVCACKGSCGTVLAVHTINVYF